MKISEMECPNCGAELNYVETSSFVACDYCGSKLHIEHDNRPTLNQTVQEPQPVKVTNGSAKAVSRKTNPTFVYMLITIFLGLLGVHRFMRGEVGMGLLYLFTGGLFGFGWIYDSIKAIIYFLKSQ